MYTEINDSNQVELLAEKDSLICFRLSFGRNYLLVICKTVVL